MMPDYELRGIDVDTPAQETQEIGRPAIDAQLGELAARLTGRLNTERFHGIDFGDAELDGFDTVA